MFCTYEVYEWQKNIFDVVWVGKKNLRLQRKKKQELWKSSWVIWCLDVLLYGWIKEIFLIDVLMCFVIWYFQKGQGQCQAQMQVWAAFMKLDSIIAIVDVVTKRWLRFLSQRITQIVYILYAPIYQMAVSSLSGGSLHTCSIIWRWSRKIFLKNTWMCCLLLEK